MRKRITAVTDKVADDRLPDIISQVKACRLNDFDRFVGELLDRAKPKRATMTAAARESPPQYRVFLSHAPGDRGFAERVARLLAAGGRIRTFADSMVSAGERWGEGLRRELEGCDVFMVIGSPRAAIADHVLYELGGAWALDKPIVVVSPEEGWNWQLPVHARSVTRLFAGDLEQPGLIEHVLDDLTRPASS